MGNETASSTPQQKAFSEYLTESGIFTKTDREYLLGERTFDKPRTEQKRRQRIRDRLKTAFVDFNLASIHLSDADRQLLFDSLIESSSPVQGWSTDVRRAQFGGLQQTLQFIYDGLTEQTGVDADKLFVQTFVEQEWVDLESADLDGMVKPAEVDDLVGALLAGREPTVRQYACLVDLVHARPELRERVFEEPASGESMTETEQKLRHIEALTERELPDLWWPVLEATQLPWTEGSLENLRQRTARVLDERDH